MDGQMDGQMNTSDQMHFKMCGDKINPNLKKIIKKLHRQRGSQYVKLPNIQS